MGLFDFLKPKPKLCTKCQALSNKRHVVYSGQRKGEKTDELCDNCLSDRLQKTITGSNFIFFEPLTSDGYVYESVEEISDDLFKQRMDQAYEQIGDCATCAEPAAHLWVPEVDLDHDSISKNQIYYSIPKEPSQWSGVNSFCDQHMVEYFQSHFKNKGFSFLTFRFPQLPGRWYYY